MIGDRTVVKLDKLHNLEYIATTAAMLTVEFDAMFDLAVAVEQHLLEPSDTTANYLKDSFNIVKQGYPKIAALRMHQIAYLLAADYLKSVEPSSNTIISTTSADDVPEEIDDNTIPLFGKNTGNIPKQHPQQTTTSQNSGNIIQLFPKKK